MDTAGKTGGTVSRAQERECHRLPRGAVTPWENFDPAEHFHEWSREATNSSVHTRGAAGSVDPGLFWECH